MPAPLPFSAADVNTMIGAQFPGAGNGCHSLGFDAAGVAFAVASRPVESSAIRPGGFVSGPTQFGLADAALWYLSFVALGRIEPMALTSELSIRFLRPAMGDVVFARATLEVAGRRNIVGSVHVWCDDREHKPTATAQGTYVVPGT